MREIIQNTRKDIIGGSTFSYIIANQIEHNTLLRKQKEISELVKRGELPRTYQDKTIIHWCFPYIQVGI